MKTNLFKILLVGCFVDPLASFAQNRTLVTVFTNPTPGTDNGFFGAAVAALGSDRVLIGASRDNTGAANAGAAHLFSTNGTLITTFTNPAPGTFDFFGSSVAAMGSDRVLIGAYNDDTSVRMDAGAAYLFSTNGTLITTFTAPSPAGTDFFGYSVAAVGNEHVLIGAHRRSSGGEILAGTAYLFGTNGALVTPFINPTPALADFFGYSVAAVGRDRVLIGAYLDDTGGMDAGAAYLFSTNGTLLNTFLNPMPALADGFGYSVAAVGSDRLLIGAHTDNTVASGAGYLFSTNGSLLTTFTNPTPASSDRFGSSVAAVGSNWVLIGAYQDDTTATNAGSVYLFSTNGTLLNTFTNPTPIADQAFGISVAAVGSDHALIGAFRPSGGVGVPTGAAYLFLIGPTLAIRRTTTNTVTTSWPSAWIGFTLQENTNSIATTNWSNVIDAIQDDGTNRSLTLPAAAMSRFYRLRK